MSLLKKITVKPWETKGIIGGLRPEGAFDAPPEKVALVVFLAVASILFSLFTVSYFMRMELPDWTPLSDPAQLWLNTGLLVISSLLFQWALNISKREEQANIMTAFIGGGVFAILFIAGQVVAWGNLHAAGFYIDANPANSFFYLLTGLHALHLLGDRIDPTEQVSAVPEEHLARLGEVDPSGRPHEELRAELGFEVTNRLADRRGRHVREPGAATERAGAGHVVEIGEMGDLHINNYKLIIIDL